MFSTTDKQRLTKRREMVKSIKFLRKMGTKLREDLNKQAKRIKQYEKKSNKLKKLQ